MGYRTQAEADRERLDNLYACSCAAEEGNDWCGPNYCKRGKCDAETPPTRPLNWALNTKPSNPKDRMGILKAGLSVIPSTVLWELGLAMLEGALKYGRHNYRVIGVRASVYYDATNRHITAFWEGEDIDPDSGVSHITKAIASLTVLRDAMIRGNWVDDRPPKTDPAFLATVNAKTKELLARYPEPVEPYTDLNKEEVRS